MRFVKAALAALTLPLTGVFIASTMPGAAVAGQFSSVFGSPANLPPSAAVEPLANPPEYRSDNGELNVTLEARPSPVQLGQFRVNGATYNGAYAGPVLRVNPGDVLRVRLINHLPQATNLHFHGLAVSPQGHGDDSLHMVLPGETWEYVIPIPKDHAPGVYWYHTHGHEFAERQLMGGLSGTLVIEGFQHEVPATEPLKERLFVLKEFTSDRKGDLNRVPKPYNVVIKTINGQLMPRIDIQPGETQLWRLSNQTADTYFRLSLQGHRFTVIGRDAHPLLRPDTVRELTFGPAQRLDVLVTGAKAGSYALVAEPTSTGPVGDLFGGQNMALLVSAPGSQQSLPPPLESLTVKPGTVKPIPGDHIDAHRLVSFSEDTLVTGLFFINHATFDHERVDFRVPLGSIEEWTIRNASEELHVFHIHQVAFQVLSENGKPVPFNGLQDTVNVPIHGEVKIRLAFTDPKIVGRFLFHCHILEHEDKGMMAQIEVYDPKAGPTPNKPMEMGDMDHVRSDKPNHSEGVGAWPKMGLATLAVLEESGLNAAGAAKHGPEPALRVDSAFLDEVNSSLSIYGLFQFKPRQPRPQNDPNRELFINQGVGRAEGGRLKELYVRSGNFRFGKFVQNFGRAYYFLPGPYARDFTEEAEQGYEPADMIGAEWIHIFNKESGGWSQLSASAFFVDRTFLHLSYPYNEGMIRYGDGGVGNTRWPENVMLTYDNVNRPVGNWAHLTWQASVIRWGRSYAAERSEFWSTLGADLTIPVRGSVDDTLRGRYAQWRLYVEGARRNNFQGVAGRARNFLSGAAEFRSGPWIADLTTTHRWTIDRVNPLQKDEFYTASLGYTLRSQTVPAISLTHERVGPVQGTYFGITITQTLTTCSRCTPKGRGY
jgi:FtsP/CotA-like multicopper oxidase with cupredoxin domain